MGTWEVQERRKGKMREKWSAQQQRKDIDPPVGFLTTLGFETSPRLKSGPQVMPPLKATWLHMLIPALAWASVKVPFIHLSLPPEAH